MGASKKTVSWEAYSRVRAAAYAAVRHLGCGGAVEQDPRRTIWGTCAKCRRWWRYDRIRAFTDAELAERFEGALEVEAHLDALVWVEREHWEGGWHCAVVRSNGANEAAGKLLDGRAWRRFTEAD